MSELFEILLQVVVTMIMSAAMFYLLVILAAEYPKAAMIYLIVIITFTSSKIIDLIVEKGHA